MASLLRNIPLYHCTYNYIFIDFYMSFSVHAYIRNSICSQYNLLLKNIYTNLNNVFNLNLSQCEKRIINLNQLSVVIRAGSRICRA